MKITRLLALTFFITVLFSCTHLNKKDVELLSLVSFLNQKKGQGGISENLEKDLLKTYKKEKKIWKNKLQQMPYSKKEYKKRNLFLAYLAKDKNLKFKKRMAKLAEEAISLENDGALIEKVLERSRSYRFVDKSKGYDKRQLEIGFCFYRSLLVHHYLLVNNFNPGDIGKVWAVGTLVAPPIVWSFHVATFVRSNERIYILDPMFEAPMGTEEWMSRVSQLSAENPNPQLRFYISDPSKFLPNSKEYSAELLTHRNIRDQTYQLLEYLVNK